MIVKFLRAFLEPFILIICVVLTIDTLFPNWKYRKVEDAGKEPKCHWCQAPWKAHGPGDWVNHASLYNQMRRL